MTDDVNDALTEVLSGGVDVRLIAVDMDGTLLDEHGRIPPGLWPLLERLSARGIAFAPASGRQHAALRREFGAAGDELVYIAENGTYVTRGDIEISSSPMERGFVDDLLREVRELPHEVGIVLCGKRSAYVEHADPGFRAEASRYYARLADVADLVDVEDDILKIALYDADDGERRTAPLLQHHTRTHQVVAAGRHWVDVMDQGVSKGTALRTLQERLGVTPAQTAAFGDYLNDLDMMDVAELSFAMADAHPELLARARFTAPSHRDHGVVTVIERLIG